MKSNTHPFETLTPDFIINAVEDQGFICDRRILALNSYENRVYQIGIEDNDPIIAKFYRPDRWTNEEILEEHAFCQELANHELPVVSPINKDGNTLFNCKQFRLALYKRKGGYAPELDNLNNLLILGRFIGRIHKIGSASNFKYRPSITTIHYGHESAAYILENYIPEHIQESYEILTKELLNKIDEIYSKLDNSDFIRVHGDCHIGNILWRNELPHFIDFDDSRMAPAIQDIWMLLSGDRERQKAQLDKIKQGYSEFSEFPIYQLKYIEVLRTLRIMYYSAWLARRWDDPAFPQAFPWFNTNRYWEQHILDLREQLGELNNPYTHI